MNQVFLTFTFKSDAPTFLLVETTEGAQFCIDEKQSIAPDQVDSVVEALQAIKASIARKQGNSSGEQESEYANEQDNGEAISPGLILPPFNFDTLEKLEALVGRKVKLRDGSVDEVILVDLECNINKEDTILLKHHSWRYSNGQFFSDTIDSRDIVKVLPKDQ